MQNLGIIQDSLGICRFTGFAFSTDTWARIASGTTGMDFSTARLEEVANRIATLERIFNLETGLEAEEDILPKRFQEEPILIGGKEKVIPLGLAQRLRSDYYLAREWDEKGRPTESLVRTLDLKGIK
jgi:aldehyde:ferredoxin oxidoreductase